MYQTSIEGIKNILKECWNIYTIEINNDDSKVIIIHEPFGSGDPETCFPKDENGNWECPKDYHSVEDDETGQCYPDDEGCPGGTVWRGKTATSHTACVDEDYCLDDPDTRNCKPENVCDHWGTLTSKDEYCLQN
jgi:hypothetical protein